MIYRCLLILSVVLIASLPNAVRVSAQSTAMVEFFAAGKLQQGLTLVDHAHQLIVIGRDGWMHSIDPREQAAKIRHTEDTYSVASVAELRNDLRAEFGPDYEVLATNSFLVVQPRGRGDRWPRMFEQSHRAFIAFMKKRGVRIRKGRFPLVAIVFPDEQAMYAEFERQKIQVSRVAGLYSGDSNRVMTHDGGRSDFIAATVRHEAAHQSAFNFGVHSRVNDTPRWITEGVGQMFEPSAMTETVTSRLPDRVNRDSLRFIRNLNKGRDNTKFSQAMMQLVSNEAMFEDPKQIVQAYAVSWAMMFYLAERQPKAFTEILNYTASRRPFQAYTRTERLQDFERIVGEPPLEFSRRVSRWLEKL
ncbi:MAG: DUF1570 domain-containing protein [Rubripirellula sp.]|nr:DUF1570 domain-containing protein [Rubripirellula sp.]